MRGVADVINGFGGKGRMNKHVFELLFVFTVDFIEYAFLKGVQQEIQGVAGD